MQELYLIRHGQAGLRNDYDRLSELGLEQAGLLGKWFRDQKIEFDSVISGGLKRQQQTAAALSQAATVDPQWSEFDLDAVYAAVAPQLAVVDAEFRVGYEELVANSADPTHPIHRVWKPTDFLVVKSWIAEQFEVDCESWEQFQLRVLEGFGRLSDLGSMKRVAVVTSATPIAIATASLFGASVQQIFELAGNLENASYSIFRRRQGGWSLAGFNHTPHLDMEKLRTMR